MPLRYILTKGQKAKIRTAIKIHRYWVKQYLEMAKDDKALPNLWVGMSDYHKEIVKGGQLRLTISRYDNYFNRNVYYNRWLYDATEKYYRSLLRKRIEWKFVKS